MVADATVWRGGSRPFGTVRWLTVTLAVSDRDTLKGKRDYAILAILIGCALRREELASLDVEIIQLRRTGGCSPIWSEGRTGPHGRRPLWVKQGINAWMAGAGIEDGRLFRSIGKGARRLGTNSASPAVWDVVRVPAAEIGVQSFGPQGRLEG